MRPIGPQVAKPLECGGTGRERAFWKVEPRRSAMAMLMDDMPTFEEVVSEWPTHTANLCPIHCGGAAGQSRPHTTILHSEGKDCKRFPVRPEYHPRRPAQTGPRDSLW